jgi:quinoprotein glucose dehydrogenase
MRPQLMLILAAVVVSDAFAQQSTAKRDPSSDWPLYRHDLAGTGYSTLSQINATNVASLKEVWSYRLQSEAAPSGRGGAGRALNSECTPIVVNGVMYLPTANSVVALKPETGDVIWTYPLQGGAPSRRGVAYWLGDKDNPPRILFTAARRLIALNANTGKLDPGFGKEGEVDMIVPYNSIPTVFKNLVMVGANVGQAPIGPSGDSRAYDARTGAKLWDFHSVPQPGEPGHDTWEGDSWKGRSGVNAWPFYMTVDQERGMVYLALASPTADFYGGDRKGANVFGNAVVAVDAATGKYKWHFQTIHHDLWDADPPAPPGLIDIAQNGKKIAALALVTKSGYMYILDRETGKPVFGVEERPVPKSDVPGEASFPTQPIPVKPPPLARVSFKPEDLVTADDTTPEHAKACRDLIEKNGGVVNAGPFTPWLYRPEGAPVKSTLVFPGGLGGANWGGTAFDPNSGYVFVNTTDNGAMGWVQKARDGSPIPFDKTILEPGPGRGAFDVPVTDANGRAIPGGNWPCQKPPWGRLTAVNANTGDIAWQVPLGITEQLPEAKQKTGRSALAGPIVTAGGVLFVGASSDNRFRAFDSKTGKELWVTKLERIANSNPLTYQANDGKQYVAIIATDTLVAFALP